LFGSRPGSCAPRFTSTWSWGCFPANAILAPRLPLPGLPGSAEFVAAYQTALAGEDARQPVSKRRGEPGTFDRLAHYYFASADFKRLAPSMQWTYPSVIERLIQDESGSVVFELRK